MNRREMLIPRPSRRRRFIPALPDYELDHLIGKLAPPERMALAQICETADLLMGDDRPWLLVPADPRLLDTLANFGAEVEDRENDLEDEPPSGDEPSLATRESLDHVGWYFGIGDDGELDECDEEPDDPEARERFKRACQRPGFTYNGITNSRYDATKDWDEQRWGEAFVARSPNRQ